MVTQVLRPETLSGHELDRLLARGWYRMGPSLFTTRTVALEDGVLRSAVWTRTDLRSFKLRPSHRKAISRLKRRYRVTHGPAQTDEQHQDLYTRYLTVAPGDRRRETLTSVLYSGGESSPFNTREIALWDGDDLAAFSWVDPGDKAVMSVIGAYAPDRAKDSLGFGTMLLEVEQAMNEDRDFHYCGYVLPGAPVMDYKLRVATELYEPDLDRWRPIEDLAGLELCVDRMRRHLVTAHRVLTIAGQRPRFGRYKSHDVGAWNPHLPDTLDHPMLLDVGRHNSALVLVAWDLEDQGYQILRCRPARFSTTAEPGFLILLLVEDRMSLGTDPHDLAPALKHMGVEPLDDEQTDP
jgi:leucyl-tRNA---protein transferase